MNFLIRLLVTAAAAYGLTHILSGVHISDFTSAFIFAIVLAVLNAIVKPLLVFLTIPITIVTLGLFLLVINALIVLLADKLLDGLKVDGFWWAFIFSILLTIVSGFLNSLVGDKEKK